MMQLASPEVKAGQMVKQETSVFVFESCRFCCTSAVVVSLRVDKLGEVRL